MIRPDPIHLALVHYHLDPGGVTRVIQKCAEVFESAGIPYVVFAGGDPANHPAGIQVHHLDELSYRDAGDDDDAERLMRRLLHATKHAFGNTPVTWWFHNHSLGKNPLLPKIVGMLAESGARLLLHLHDLVENGRPHNLPRIPDRNRLYPLAPRIHYLFLNSRDHQVFLQAGLPPARAHLVPNLVNEPPAGLRPARDGPQPLVFYPVRGIRRKNLGEVLLLSALAPAGTRFAISRAPKNVIDLTHHDFWLRHAARHDLPVDFAVTGRIPPPGSADSSYDSWTTASTHRLTTSIEEGFGLTLFEALASRTPAFGRRLSNMKDQLPEPLADHLYDRLLVPDSWIDPSRLRQRVAACVSATGRAWKHDFPPQHVDAVMDHLNRSGYLDFGNLPEEFQAAIVTRCIDPASQSEILVEQRGVRSLANHWVREILSGDEQSHHTSQIPPPSTGDWLRHIQTIATSVADSPACEVVWIDSRKVLAPFLDSDGFHFLKSP